MHHFTIHRKIHRTALGATYECSFNDPKPTNRRRAPLVLKISSLATRKRLATVLAEDHTIDHVAVMATVDDPLRERDVVRRLIASGGHDHVLQCYDQFMTQDEATGDESVCIVSDYCNGGDLFSYLPSTGGVSETEAMYLMRQVLRGVLFLQTRLSLAHRDLSLENVFLRDGICKVADFGLAVPLNEKSYGRVGKQPYMAPEVVKDNAHGYDPAAADVWSLGVMLFMLLTGCSLVDVASPEDPHFVALARGGVGTILSVWGLSVAPELVKVMGTMLQEDPAQRPSAANVLSTLNTLSRLTESLVEGVSL